MKTRPLTIQIPEPDEEGLCLTSCDLIRKLVTTNEWFYKCKYGEIVDKNYCKPGPGCPWYNGGKDD